MGRFRYAALRLLILCGIPVFLLLSPELIHTHDHGPGPLLRPLVTVDHALCLAAAALLAGQQRDKNASFVWLALGALAAALSVGFFAIQFVEGFTYEGLVPLVLALAYGLTVALEPRLPGWRIFVAVALAGLSVGFNTYPPQSDVMTMTKTLTGLLMGAGIMFTGLAWLARMADAKWQAIGVRIAGSWAAAIAALVLALTFEAMGLGGLVG